MATVYRAICIKDYVPAPLEDPNFILKRGREYTISSEKEGQVRVFSQYWVWVPSNLFAGIENLT